MNASLKKIVFLHPSSNSLSRDHFDSCHILRQVRVSLQFPKSASSSSKMIIRLIFMRLAGLFRTPNELSLDFAPRYSSQTARFMKRVTSSRIYIIRQC